MVSEATRAIQRTFLGSPAFAVVGASKDQSKYGTKVSAFYLTGEVSDAGITGPQVVSSS